MNPALGALGLTLPLLQAGMGGVAGPKLCAAVSEAGAGGTLALYREPPDRVARLVRNTAAATARPFGVNVIPEVTGPVACRAQVRAALEHLPAHGFVTFFGLPAPDLLREVTRSGHRTVVQVGSSSQADGALEYGADVLVLQGEEAGGHLLGTAPGLSLLSDVRARYPRAVLVLAGGIATGADLAHALARGADGALAGTLFVPARESDAHPAYKRRVAAATAHDTVVTSLFDIGWPGRPHRVLRNPLTGPTGAADRRPAYFIATTEARGRSFPIPRYSAVAPSAGTRGRVMEMAMYCGRSCDRVFDTGPVGAVLDRFRQEYAAAVAQEYVEAAAAARAPSPSEGGTRHG
ncbi:NAD(P)H-dependent flavin oxidoreductase [Streptomyces sp. H27-D2]|uniref:NAD(P)H-dependent flavin oxidoreductase n=1 Tax=Streptomyces sp. H27-D2 TaxID=3046304 RepID=UPI002DB969BC|nr:nitronate monooxygenase [Streptomyces sp. H27-D2]MEC4019433.1 nitronate monooxygenase [Streptomyces sp. H27-D2]